MINNKNFLPKSNQVFRFLFIGFFFYENGKSRLKNVLTLVCYEYFNSRRCYCFELERNLEQKEMYEERALILNKNALNSRKTS